MQVEFDPDKDADNLRKHGLSLARSGELAIEQLVTSGRDAYGGERVRAYGLLGGRFHVLVFTVRGDVIRARSACDQLAEGSTDVMSKPDPALNYSDATMDDSENPEWTEEDFKSAKTIDQLTPELQTVIRAAFPNTGASAPPLRRDAGPPRRKTPVSIRLDPDVVNYFKQTGAGWQSRINAALRAAMEAGG